MIALLLGCTLPEEEETEVEAPLPIEALWTTQFAVGDVVTLGPVQITSPKTVDGRYFLISDPAGGPRSSAVVVVGALLYGWPPPIGTTVTLTATIVRTGPAPAVELLNGDDGLVTAKATGEALPAWPISDDTALDTALEYALVTASDLTVTSSPDPLGEADTDTAVGIGGRFGISPGWGRQGSLTGILVQGRISARIPEDWTGELESDPPVPVGLPALGAMPEGTLVKVEDLVLATPWSRDARWAVVQDAQGKGVWLDAESWGLSAMVEGPTPAASSAVGTWTGEVRHRADGLVLRVWSPPLLERARQVRASPHWADGAIAEISVAALGPPDTFGERNTDEGLQLDDRFLDLRGLPTPNDLVGAVRIEPDGTTWLAPFGLGTL